MNSAWSYLGQSWARLTLIAESFGSSNLAVTLSTGWTEAECMDSSTTVESVVRVQDRPSSSQLLPSPQASCPQCGHSPFSFIEWCEFKKAANIYGKLVADRVSDRSREIKAVLDSMNLNVKETNASVLSMATEDHPGKAKKRTLLSVDAERLRRAGQRRMTLSQFQLACGIG